MINLRIKDWRFFRRALFGGDIGVGESYMAGEWDCSDLAGLIRLVLRKQRALDYRSLWMWMSRLLHGLHRLADANTLRGSRRNIRYHYDLSNDLYRLFLDESMTYSCAMFSSPGDTLEQAQREKVDGICRRLELQPGQHVLEIGSGWGSFAMHAARNYGCRVTGITLSQDQYNLARQRVSDAGLADLVDIQLRDYRRMSGCFDHIVSIEMFEAVGYQYYGAFFSACERLLKPQGRMFLQTITVPDQRFDTYRREFDWIRKYIFPGGCLASVAAIVAALKRHSNLQLEWLREIGPHYAPTLRNWRKRFLGKLPEVRRLGFDDRFIRMWEFYLASCEASFATRHIGDVQMLLGRPLEPRQLPA